MKIFVIKASKLLTLVCLAFLLSSCNKQRDSIQGVWKIQPNQYLQSTLTFTQERVYIDYEYDLGIPAFCLPQNKLTYSSPYSIEGDKIIIERTGEVFTITNKDNITLPYLSDPLYFSYQKRD